MDTQAEILQQRIRIKASDTDLHQHLKMSVLTRFLQEISIAHTEALGCTKDQTLDKGLLWVVSRVRFQLTRPILYDETIELQSWPGRTRHVLFPRYYRILDHDGKPILTGSSIWMLIDHKRRSFIFPDRFGIAIPGYEDGSEPDLPEELPTFEAQTKSRRRAVFSDLDLNGHVNNTRYLDWVDDLHLSSWHLSHQPRDLQINFRREILPEEETVIRFREQEDSLLAEGVTSGRVSFSLKMVF